MSQLRRWHEQARRRDVGTGDFFTEDGSSFLVFAHFLVLERIIHWAGDSTWR